MSTIAHVTTRVVPVRNTALPTAYASTRVAAEWRSHLFVRVETADGHVGVAEGSPLPHFSGENAESMAAVIEARLAPALYGLNLFGIEAIQQKLELTVSGHFASKSTLINALFDAQGRRLGLPVSDLLGGRLTDRLPLTGVVGLVETTQAIADLQRFHEAGIRTFKLKAGRDIRRDAQLVQTVRSKFGNDVQLRVDANGGWDRADARRFLRQVENCDLQYVEQPLPAGDLSGLAELRQLGSVPIAADESLFGLQDALTLISQQAADVFIIKLIKHGGLHVARKIAAAAEGAGISCVLVSPYETALGASAGLQLAASSPAFPWAVEVGAGPLQIDAPGLSPLAVEDGHVLLPAGPGLGVDASR